MLNPTTTTTQPHQTSTLKLNKPQASTNAIKDSKSRNYERKIDKAKLRARSGKPPAHPVLDSSAQPNPYVSSACVAQTSIFSAGANTTTPPITTTSRPTSTSSSALISTKSQRMNSSAGLRKSLCPWSYRVVPAGGMPNTTGIKRCDIWPLVLPFSILA